MPIHYVNTPDGKRIEVNAPNGATQEQIVAYAQKQYAEHGDNPATAKPKESLQALFQRAQAGDPNALAQYNARAQSVGQNTIEQDRQANNPAVGNDNFVSGVGSAFVNTGMGLKQAGLEAGNKLGLVNDSSLADYRSQVDEEKRLQSPLLDTAAGTFGNIGGNVAIGVLGGNALAPLKAAKGATWLARGGIAAGNGGIGGAALGLIQPAGTGETRLGNAVQGAKYGLIGGAAGHTLGTGIGRLAKGASDKYGEMVMDIYNRAKAAGVPIYPHQLSDSRIVKTLASFLGQFPLTGGAKANKQQIDAYTKMVSKIIGQDSDSITPDILKSAGTARDSMYDNALKGVDIPVGQDAYVKLLQARNRAGSLTTDEKAMFDDLIDEIQSNAPNGVMSGDVYQTLRRGWQQNANKVSKEVKGIMEANTASNIPSQNVAMFKQANRMHGNLKTVERAMKGADTNAAKTYTEGKVNPATFRSAIGTKYQPSKEIEMAARIGQKIKDPIADSGSIGRLVVAGGLGTTAGVAGATALAPLAKLIAIGSTAGRAVNSQALSGYMAKGAPKVIQGVARQIEQKAPSLLAPMAAGASLAFSPLMSPTQFDAKLNDDMKAGRLNKKQAATQLDAYLQTISRREGVDAARAVYKQFPQWSSVMNN